MPIFEHNGPIDPEEFRRDQKALNEKIERLSWWRLVESQELEASFQLISDVDPPANESDGVGPAKETK